MYLLMYFIEVKVSSNIFFSFYHKKCVVNGFDKKLFLDFCFVLVLY